VFEILEIAVNFIRIMYALYGDVIEILNSQLRYILPELSASNRKFVTYSISW